MRESTLLIIILLSSPFAFCFTLPAGESKGGVIPHICGTAVYDARVMLGLDFNDFEDAEQRVAQEEENEISINDEDGNYKGVLYPNPASDYVIYKTWLNEGETLTIVFYDVMGKPIILKQISDTVEEQFDLSKISSGIYFYKITLNQKQVQAGKLIISK